MEKKLIKSIFLRFKTNNIRLKIQCPQGRADPGRRYSIELRNVDKSSFLFYIIFAIIIVIQILFRL